MSTSAPSAPLGTSRERAKAQRRSALLHAAADLFAERGFERVSLEDLGAAVGISGPAVYRHFASKQAVLAALLIDVSRELVAGADAVVASSAADGEKLRELIAFHVEFALSNADVILVQDRDLDSLAPDDLATVRSLQRGYIDAWVAVLASIHPDVAVGELRIRARATFGLINSTPHSARTSPRASVRALLESMALAALTV
ncbi:MAG TPA: TetR/AcrR family transcriptional regulator [Galbitalea sp.]|jgi:AcrR family transcriptional regulator|nr:TetR/AcrR family transcriptional regulator [Galbitalea sp.]